MGRHLDIISALISFCIWGNVLFARGENLSKSLDEFIGERTTNPLASGEIIKETRNPKLFPYFLIQFPNEPCSGTNGSGGGVCVSQKECRQAGGTTVGTCAQGFGACCKYTKRCGRDGGDVQIRENSTDIKSSNRSSSCRFVLPKMRGICQVKLDFTHFHYGRGLSSGDCSSNKLKITSNTLLKDSDLCGNMTGQHLYLTYGNEDKFYILAPDSISDWDVYSIRVNYIRCNSELSVPPHCTQYYSGLSGEIRSLNWPAQQLNNQDYTVCIATPKDNASKKRSGRMGATNSKIHWSTCKSENGNSPFFISGKLGDPPVSDPRECTSDFIQIFGGNRQCGNSFKNVSVSSLPYLLHVKFDEKEIEGIGIGPSAGGITVSKPREGCGSLNTQDTKCEENAGNGPILDEVTANETEIIDGGICRCINAPGQESKKINDDINNTGFCLSYKITI